MKRKRRQRRGGDRPVRPQTVLVDDRVPYEYVLVLPSTEDLEVFAF